MQRHDLNTHFQWQETSGPYRLISDTQAQQYDAAGYFLFENAFSADEIAAVRGAIDPLEEHYTAVLRDKHSARQRQAGADSAITAAINRADAITFSIHLVKRAKVLKDFSRHPVFQGLCHDLIGPGARLYWDQAVYKKPGNPEDFPWHQDNGYTFTEPQQYLTCWVALTDATTENGCP